MVLKGIIFVLLALIIFNMGRGLFFLLNTNPDRDIDKLAKALTWRVGFSLVLLVLLIIAFAFGWLAPHGI